MIIQGILAFFAAILGALLVAFLPAVPTLSAQDYSAFGALVGACAMWNQVINGPLAVELLAIVIGMKTTMVGWRAFQFLLGHIPFLH